MAASCLKCSSSCSGSPGVGNHLLRTFPAASFAMPKKSSARNPVGLAPAAFLLVPSAMRRPDDQVKCLRKVVQSKRAPSSVRPVRPWKTSRASSAAWWSGSNLPRSCGVRRPSSSLSASSKASRSVASNSAPLKSMQAATNSVQPTLPSQSKSMASAAFPAWIASAPTRCSAAATCARSTRPPPAELRASNQRLTLGHWFAGQRRARDMETLL
mmetsp:Transcript_12926/g.37285  ORF Transcript_12926/g.37285 Transcript_12926/m.37285 type:complete len:213 (+) Transcript_12926:230-868(+)